MPNETTTKAAGLRVLVCGGRDYDDLGAVWSQLDAFHAIQGPITAVIHGDYRGADTLAKKWAVSNNVKDVPFKADWGHLGPAAGPIRNTRMLEEGRPDLVIAFPGGKGTLDCVSQAKERGVEVVQPYG